MKIVYCITLVVIMFLAGCTTESDTVSNSFIDNYLANKKQDIRDLDPAILGVAEISLPGMSCAGCAMGAESGFYAITGVVEVDIDLNNKKGSVVYDKTKTDANELVGNGIIQGYGGELLIDRAYAQNGKTN
jgi:copper chaperone CopZ